jgi:redox-regulated HSP33 family molecular chaperone
MNLGLYLAESEQRTAAMITDVNIDRNLCRYSLGILAEALPGADPENVEKCIKNLENIEKKGLYSYLIRTQEERDKQTGMFRDFESCLQSIVDDCFIGMGTSFQWTKTPKYSCSCGVDKVWRTLRLLPKSELVELIETQNSVEVSDNDIYSID